MSLDDDDETTVERGSRAAAPTRQTHPGRRWLEAGSLTAVVLLAVAGTAAWDGRSPAPDEGPILAVSDPEPASPRPADGSDADGSPTRSPGRDTRSTPAQVGRAAASQVEAERPLMVSLASGTSMRIRVSATATTGDLEIPANINQAGWWDGGSRLGDPFGAIVVAAHVDSFTQGLGRFAELLSTQPGDVVRLDSADSSERFQVVSAKLVPKTSISAASAVFSAQGQSRLVLITCGGQYDTAHGGYQSNMVVVATPAGRLVSRD